MYSYTLGDYKTVLHEKTYLNQLIAVNPVVESFTDDGENIKVNCTSSLLTPEISALNDVIPANQPANEVIRLAVSNAIDFGNRTILDAITENVLLGITQAGMTHTVAKRMFEVNSALTSGSLYDAIHELKIVPEEHKDGVFISDDRLLSVVNKIETYLNIPLSVEL